MTGKLLKFLFAYFLVFLFAYLALRIFGVYGIVLYVSTFLFLALVRYPRLRYLMNRKEVNGRSGHIYGFGDIGQIIPLIKIGRSSDEKSRLSSHNTAAPFGMIVYFNFPVNDAVYVERLLHQRYKFAHANREWFFILTPLMLFEILLLRFFGAGKISS